MRSQPRHGDPFAVSFRMQTLKTGIWPTMLVCIYSSMYYAWSWERPNRLALTVIIGLAFAASLAIALLPMERIVKGAWREPFFISWSCGLIVLISLSAGLDGGVGSPLTSLYFLPLVYASLSYPFASMLAVGGANLGGFLALSAFAPEPSASHVFIFAGALVSATVICAWQARNHARHRDELERASLTDPLTGCLNRRGFEDRLDARLREGREVALMVFDLDDFKRVNDRSGHAAGDALLRWVADVMSGTLRADDVVGRLGGDEFAAIVTGGDSRVVLQRVVAALAERASASAGIAIFPHDGDTPDELHAVADADMYAGKRERTPVR